MDIKYNNNFSIKCGRDIARYLEYFSKMNRNKNFTMREINIVNISGISLYRKHKKICDKAYEIQEKYNIDFVKYIKFFISKFKLTDSNVKKLLDINIIKLFANEEYIKAKYNKVYNYIQKSVDNIVKECIENNYSSVKEYLKYIIQENKLADKYISGTISQYYLAGIRNFKKIVQKMNNINQETFEDIINNQDKLMSDMQDAFTYLKGCRINVITYTNNRLIECLSKNN